jgi:hypothetical protein
MEREPKTCPVAKENRSGDGVEKKEPIADIEVSPDALEEWEKLGLGGEVRDVVFGFEELVAPGEKFAFHTANFESTSRFMEKTEYTFSEFSAKNRDKKIREVDDSVRKVILNFAFKELGFDVLNPQLVKEEKISVNKREAIIRYFATNQPDKFLVFNGEYWYLEEEKKIPNN